MAQVIAGPRAAIYFFHVRRHPDNRWARCRALRMSGSDIKEIHCEINVVFLNIYIVDYVSNKFISIKAVSKFRSTDTLT